MTTGYAVQQHVDHPPYLRIDCIRLFATRRQAERCYNGFGPVAEVSVEAHWRGPLPEAGARFTPSDVSYRELLALIAEAEPGDPYPDIDG